MNDISDFGAKLKDWRGREKLLQKEAADVLGVSVRTYQAWEGRARSPNEIMQAELFRRMNSHKTNE